MGQLQDKIAIVTGSSKGIGQGIAIRYAKEGAKVVVNYRGSPGEAEETVNQVKAAGSDAIVAQGDVSKIEDLKRVFDQAIDKFGHVDILVNNAGIEKEAKFTEVTEEHYDQVLAVNLKGVFFGSQLMAKHLIETGRPGRIINISSVHEELPFPRHAPYCASKGGVRMLTRTLAVELGEHGITVNGIAPGAIATPINEKMLQDKERVAALEANIPLGRIGKPEDVAGVAVFLASDDAAYVTGSTYFVDGGITWNYDE